MTAAEIIGKLDALSEKLSDAELREWLSARCTEYETENPGDAVGAAALWNELGGICRRNRWLEEGEQAFLRAKLGLERDGIRDGNYATTLNNLAGLYRLSGELERAFGLFFEARELYARVPGLPVDVLASACNNLGLLHLDAGRFDEALEEFEKAAEMIAAIPENHYVHAVTAGNSAIAHYRLGDRKRAAEMLLAAAAQAEMLSDGGKMKENYMELYRRMGGSGK